METHQAGMDNSPTVFAIFTQDNGTLLVESLRQAGYRYIAVDALNMGISCSNKVRLVISFADPASSSDYPRGTPVDKMVKESALEAYEAAKIIIPACRRLIKGSIILTAGVDKMCCIQLGGPTEASTVSPDITFPKADKFGGDVLLERLCRTAGLAEDTEMGFIWVRNNSDAYPHATNSHRVRVTRRTWEYLNMLPRGASPPMMELLVGGTPTAVYQQFLVAEEVVMVFQALRLNLGAAHVGQLTSFIVMLINDGKQLEDVSDASFAAFRARGRWGYSYQFDSTTRKVQRLEGSGTAPEASACTTPQRVPPRRAHPGSSPGGASTSPLSVTGAEAAAAAAAGAASPGAKRSHDGSGQQQAAKMGSPVQQHGAGKGGARGLASPPVRGRDQPVAPGALTGHLSRLGFGPAAPGAGADAAAADSGGDQSLSHFASSSVTSSSRGRSKLPAASHAGKGAAAAGSSGAPAASSSSSPAQGLPAQDPPNTRAQEGLYGVERRGVRWWEVRPTGGEKPVQYTAAGRQLLDEAVAAAEGQDVPAVDFFLQVQDYTFQERQLLRRRQQRAFNIADSSGRGTAVPLVPGTAMMPNGKNVMAYCNKAVNLPEGRWAPLPEGMVIMMNQPNAANGPDAASEVSNLGADLKWTPPPGEKTRRRRAPLPPAATQGSAMACAVGEAAQQLAAYADSGGQQAAAGAEVEVAQGAGVQDAMELDQQQQAPESPAGSTGSAAAGE